MSDDFFAAPPFDPAAARTGLERAWRELGLQARERRFERRGHSVATVEIQDQALQVQLARRPSTRPDWDCYTLRNAADVRRCTDELKRRLARWDDET